MQGKPRVRPSTAPAVHALSFPADSPCSNLLGMLSGLIPDSQISASSIRGYDWSPSMARLVSSRSGWFPRVPQAQPGEEWLQVDLGIPKNIKGVIIQGARGGDSVTTTESRSFVKKFKVAYSMNGKDWDFIQDPKTMQAKVRTAWSSCKTRYFSGCLQSASWGLGKLAVSPHRDLVSLSRHHEIPCRVPWSWS